jgi:hypothetical protein
MHIKGKSAGDQTLKRLGQAESKGRAPLFLVSKQNLNPSYWHIWHTKSCPKWNRIEKVWRLKVERGVNN